jgi:hypothetical protein
MNSYKLVMGLGLSLMLAAPVQAHEAGILTTGTTTTTTTIGETGDTTTASPSTEIPPDSLMPDDTVLSSPDEDTREAEDEDTMTMGEKQAFQERVQKVDSNVDIMETALTQVKGSIIFPPDGVPQFTLTPYERAQKTFDEKEEEIFEGNVRLSEALDAGDKVKAAAETKSIERLHNQIVDAITQMQKSYYQLLTKALKAILKEKQALSRLHSDDPAVTERMAYLMKVETYYLEIKTAVNGAKAVSHKIDIPK